MSGKLRVAITGATSGLGAEMALQLARRGARVAVTGRREGRLRELERAVSAAGGECLALAGSVAEPETVRRHYAAIRERWGGLDWAILNAGISETSSAIQFSSDVVRRTFETNVFGAAQWLEAVLPDMVVAGRGTIAGIASVAAWRGLPGAGAYCASKAALATLLESARVDLRGTGVRVVTVCPGYVKSEMVAGRDPAELWFLLETEDGARRILRGIEQGRRLVAFPWQLAWLMRYAVRHLPGFLYDPLVAGFAPRRAKKGRSSRPGPGAG